jgi:protein-tyrosine phosphatase
MNCIRPWLYVGKFAETRNLPLLQHYAIKAVLQLAEPINYPDIRALYLPVIDAQPLSSEHLKSGVDFVHMEKTSGHKVLIACGAGISRSVTFAVATLKEEENLCLLDALRAVAHEHREAMPHPALWRSLCQHYGEPVDFDALFATIQEAK